MIERVLSFLKERISSLKLSTQSINLKSFEVLEPKGSIYAVDGGYRKVIDLGRESLYLIRVGFVKYNRDKRVDFQVKNTFVYISDEDVREFGGLLKEKDLEYFRGKIWDMVENKGNDYETAEKNIVSAITRLLELREGRERDGIVLFDFPFEFRFEIHKEEYKKISSKKVGLAKKSRLKEYSKVIGIRREGRFYIESEHESLGKEFFVKYGYSSKCLFFRTSLDKDVENPEEIFGELAYYSDESRLGYLFPLMRIDKMVRVSDEYVNRLRRRILYNLGDSLDLEVVDLKFL